MIWRGLAAAVVFSFLAMSVEAADIAGYKALISESIKEIDSGSISDLSASIARQEKAMELGLEMTKEHAKKHPEDAKLMDLVVASAPAMKSESAEDIEAKWGDEGTAADAIGKPLKSLGQFSLARSALDVVVHPARVMAFLKDYGKTKSKTALADAKGELVEVLHHAEIVEKGK